MSGEDASVTFSPRLHLRLTVYNSIQRQQYYTINITLPGCQDGVQDYYHYQL